MHSPVLLSGKCWQLLMDQLIAMPSGPGAIYRTIIAHPYKNDLIN